MFVYMLVTEDKFELPLAIADSAAELARMLGVDVNLIYSAVSKAKKRGGRSKYVKVVF